MKNKKRFWQKKIGKSRSNGAKQTKHAQWKKTVEKTHARLFRHKTLAYLAQNSFIFILVFKFHVSSFNKIQNIFVLSQKMYRRDLTRIEIKLEDIQEYEKIKRENDLHNFEIKSESCTKAKDNDNPLMDSDQQLDQQQQTRQARIGLHL